jgi:hypothetical protein
MPLILCIRAHRSKGPTLLHVQAESAEPSDDAIKRTLDYLHDRAQGATYFVASDPGEKVMLSCRSCLGAQEHWLLAARTWHAA